MAFQYNNIFGSHISGICEVSSGIDKQLLVFPGRKCGSIQLVVSLKIIIIGCIDYLNEQYLM